jgi:hypothetical protein
MSFLRFGPIRRGRLRMRFGAVSALGLLAFGLAIPGAAPAQAVHAGEADGLTYFAGATGSGYYVQYGERKLLGVSGFVDADNRRHFGVEAEGRWLVFHQQADIHATTFTVGPRYRFEMGRFQPYAKVLAGVGEFNFTYNLAHGSYLAIAPGGGVDCRLSRRIRLRLIDAEYQYWPQFTFSPMSSFGVSTGFRVRIF